MCVSNNKGYSLIEIIIAMLIFAIVAISLLSAITNADRIKSRGTSVGNVASIARNESEVIKNIAYLNGTLNDTTYDVVYNKKEYSVERKLVNDELGGIDTEENSKSLQELVITISEKNNPEKKWIVNVVQGFTN